MTEDFAGIKSDIFYQIVQYVDDKTLIQVCGLNKKFNSYGQQTRIRLLPLLKRLKRGYFHTYVIDPDKHDIIFMYTCDFKFYIWEHLLSDQHSYLKQIFKNEIACYPNDVGDKITVHCNNDSNDSIRKLLSFILEQTNINPYSFKIEYSEID